MTVSPRGDRTKKFDIMVMIIWSVLVLSANADADADAAAARRTNEMNELLSSSVGLGSVLVLACPFCPFGLFFCFLAAFSTLACSVPSTRKEYDMVPNHTTPTNRD